MVREIVAEGSMLRNVAYKVVNSALYTVEERKDNGARYIGVYVLSRQGGEWGYKSMDESMGPYYFDCPLKFLDMVPEPESQYAKEWRQKVRAKVRPLAVGDKVRLIDGCKFRGQEVKEVMIQCTRPLIVTTPDGTNVALKKSLIEGVA